MVAGQAANMAVHAALEKKGSSDDITVLVVDFCADPADKQPASLLGHAHHHHHLHHASASAASLTPAHSAAIDKMNQAVLQASGGSHMWRPLELPSATWRCVRCRLLACGHRPCSLPWRSRRGKARGVAVLPCGAPRRERLGLRRLAALHKMAVHAEEQRAAEKAAEEARARAAGGASSGGVRGPHEVSDTYRELAELHIDMEDLAQ